MKGRGAFTLVECVVAGALASVVSIALFFGAGGAARVAADSAARIAASDRAADEAWTLFNLSISELSALAASSDSRVSEDLSGQGYRISVPIEGEGTSIVYFRCAGMERGE